DPPGRAAPRPGAQPGLVPAGRRQDPRGPAPRADLRRGDGVGVRPRARAGGPPLHVVLRRHLTGRYACSGSSPVSSRCSNAASSRIGTPSSSALVSLEAPGPSPTTSAVVFFETLPGDL